MKILRAILAVSTMLVTLSAQAAYRFYEAKVDRAIWEQSGNPVYCELKHEIPRYGVALFSSEAGRQENLQFHLELERDLPNQSGQALLRSQAPAWRPGVPSKELGRVVYEQGNIPFRLPKDDAWRLLSELELGMFPTFFYEDWVDGQDQIAVGMSAVNFIKAYKQFLQCMDNLLPYTFADIAQSTLYFDFDKYNFNKKTQARLDQIRRYLEADPDVDVAIVTGHTDSRGGRWYNKKLGEKRALAVKDFLIESGVAAEKISIKSHGERKPVASNKTEQGRALNRRVLLKMRK